ncbi:MAG: ABC transporter ATP-binding protein [Actinobacteria bacterium]|nr:ABC transporter ATP-binding protein [Actinomycetota bacterium]
MTSSDPVTIVADQVDFGYRDQRVLHGVSVEVGPGARLGIVGDSGSGKSTLAKLLVGAIDPRGADITVNGVRWSEVRRRSPLRRAVQMIQQDPFASLNPHLSARSAVREAARVGLRQPRRAAAELADELLESVGIGPSVARRRPRELSGGQCQRVAIARALAARPAVIVADEPTSALDLSVQAQIINLIMDVLAERETALVMVSHDLAVIRHLTRDIVVVHDGRVVERGATRDVLENPQNPYTQGLCAHLAWAD